MHAIDVFHDLAVTGAACAAPVEGGDAVGHDMRKAVSPASVVKIQVALAVETAIAEGALDGSSQRHLPASRRTPGPVGISLMRDDVQLSIRDLVTLMLTISDNVATDELIGLVGLDEINRLTTELGLSGTRVATDLRTMLDEMAVEAGFDDYAALARHDPVSDGPPTAAQVRARLARSAPLDPARGTRTTAADTVRLLQLIWTDAAGSAAACASIRRAMGQQLTRHRIAAGFGPGVSVAAKSGGLIGVVRNEAAVVTYPDGRAFAVAVFTRNEAQTNGDPASIDAGIGAVARLLVDELRER
jgi:beta-lactamase class A